MILTTKDAAREIKVSERFLRRLVREKKIPFLRLSERTLRFDSNELRHHMRVLASGKHKRERNVSTSDEDQGR